MTRVAKIFDTISVLLIGIGFPTANRRIAVQAGNKENKIDN